MAKQRKMIGMTVMDLIRRRRFVSEPPRSVFQSSLDARAAEVMQGHPMWAGHTSAAGEPLHPPDAGILDVTSTATFAAAEVTGITLEGLMAANGPEKAG